jgi:hypothetical protein
MVGLPKDSRWVLSIPPKVKPPGSPHCLGKVFHTTPFALPADIRSKGIQTVDALSPKGAKPGDLLPKDLPDRIQKLATRIKLG